MRQTRQGGSSVVFILVGVLLAALLVGGVYALRQQTVQKPIAVTPQPQNAPSTASEKPKEDNKKEEASSNTEASEQKGPVQGQTEVHQSQSSATASELPRTGGSESAGIVLIVALIIGTFVAYINSRRAVRLSF